MSEKAQPDPIKSAEAEAIVRVALENAVTSAALDITTETVDAPGALQSAVSRSA